MTVAVIILAVALAGATASIVALGVWLRSALAGERAALAVEGIANRAQLLAERERNDAVARAAQLEKERDVATAALVKAQGAANAAREELVRRVQSQILDATPGDAARIVGDLLGEPLPGVVVAARDPADPSA